MLPPDAQIESLQFPPSLQSFGRDAHAAVLHDHLLFAFQLLQRYAYLTVIRELDGIAQQLHEYLLDTAIIPQDENGQGGIDLCFQFQAFLFGQSGQ